MAISFGFQWNCADKLFADPQLGIDAADARQLHLVLVTVGPVQALQPLHRPVVGVEDQPLHGQQRRADVDLQQPRHLGIGQPGRDALRARGR